MTLPAGTERVLKLIMLGTTTSGELSLKKRPGKWKTVVDDLKRLERAGMIQRGPWVRGIRRPIRLTRRAFFE